MWVNSKSSRFEITDKVYKTLIFFIVSDQKMAAIKHVRDYIGGYSCGLKEAKEIIDNIETELKLIEEWDS